MTEQESTAADLNLAGLTERLQKLERAVAELQDTQLLEARIVERLQSQQGKATAGQRGAEAAAKAAPAPAAPAPAAVEAPPHVPPPPARPAPAPAAASASQETAPAWLLFDISREARNMIAMFFDIHYRVGWMSRTVAVVLLCVLLFVPDSWWVPMSWIPVIGYMLINIVKLLAAFFVYKLLSREARRYQAFRNQAR